MEELKYDVVVIGGGPAGLSAAIYAARSGMSVAVVDKGLIGGQPQYYLNIENYPGYTGNSATLSQQIIDQAVNFVVTLYDLQELASVKIECSEKEVCTQDYTFKSKALVIATGAHPRLLNVAGEKEYLGRGVSYCAICDGPFYKDKEVAVIGGGNAAIEEACYLTNFASKVHVLHRRSELRADKVVQERAFSNPKIEFWWQSQVGEIIGDGEHVTQLYFLEEGEPAMLDVSGVFPYIGFLPNTEFLDDKINKNKEGYIITDECMRTSVGGVFAAGDVRVTPLRQVVTAVADGAIAGTSASRYVSLLKSQQ